MKKKFALALAALLLLAFTGCSSSQTAGSQNGETDQAVDQLAAIQEKGEIVIAMEGTWAPWTYHDDTDTLVGFDTEVGQAIAQKLGVTPTFVEGEWDSLFAGLDSGRYDIVINGVEITEARAEKYDFSTPYCYIKTALIVREDNTDIQSFEDLEGKTTCNSIASTYMDLAESYGASATGVDTLEETLQMVLAGRVDATLNAEVSFYDYMNVHPDAQLKVVALTQEASQVAIPMRKGEESAALREAIDQAIQELREDGTLAQLSQKYFGSDITAE